ncbi:hypothetical Protein YC6258_01367 [Gynuella sunshinyii YC6258]|uniref:Uncharacterized protein n=1 Tax=Gynuella sunshinyii YC6258 TaxID=1445510 RepID=A0A0C5V1J6_9GAMM|nr:hypothetical Protein YC6258_01367 [Gynuella sunshinyii YC6258]
MTGMMTSVTDGLQFIGWGNTHFMRVFKNIDGALCACC